jgi:hypothetical protein
VIERPVLPFVTISCPYCGESIDIAVDASSGPETYIEDCQVCCRPIVLTISLDEDGEPVVYASSEDEA